MTDALDTAHRLAVAYLGGVADRPVGVPADREALVRALDVPLGDDGVDPATVLEELAAAADPGIVASNGPRYFGFVIGGALEAALGADWLTAAWDQNAALEVMSPAAAIVETVAARWILDLLGLPPGAGVGFTTGAQMANVTCLAAARQAVLAAHGWDAGTDGLQGAPELTVIAGEEAHVTVFTALRLLGLGAGRARLVGADGQGRIDARAAAAAVAGTEGPLILCGQAGNVNTGAIDDLDALADVCAGREDAWLHVDGAFGLWAAVAPSLRGLVAGAARADSWASDGHKWLNVPYDGGLAIVADAEVQRSAMSLAAAYLPTADGVRDGASYVPEASRRARAFPVYAALRQLGRRGLAELVERSCALARQFAERLGAEPGLEVLNEVTLNQVLVRVGDDDRATAAAIEAVQRDGTCWVGGTVWRGRGAIRISVSGAETTAEDVERSAAAIIAAARPR